MTKLASAFVELRSDASGLRSEARREVDSAMAGVRAIAEMVLDASGLAGEARRAARIAGEAAEIEIAAMADTEGLRAEVVAAAVQAGAGVTADVDVVADATGLRAEVTREVAAAEAGQSIDVPVNSGPLRDARGRFTSGGGGGGGGGPSLPTGPVDRFRDSLGGADRASKGFARGLIAAAGAAGLVSSAVSVAAGSVGALAAGTVALTAALGPATGLLGAIPGLATTASQGLGTILLATSGVGEALKAMSQAEDDAATTATAAAQASQAAALLREAAAERVRSATLAVSETEQRAADANLAAIRRVEAARRGLAAARQGEDDAAQRSADDQAAANRRVEQAQRSLVDAQRDAQRSQEDLTQARRDELRALQDLQERVDDYALSEEDAALRIREARERAAEVNADPFASQTERDRARLSIEQAIEAQDDLVRQRDEDAAALAEANARGVEGSDRVVDARQRAADSEQAVRDAVEAASQAQEEQARTAVRSARELADAQRASVDAARDLGEAQRAAARAQVNGASDVAEAQRDLTLALRDQGRAADEANAKIAAGADKAALALGKLSPEARSFAEFLFDLRPELDALKAAAGEKLFPGLEISLTTLRPLFATFRDGAREAGGAIGETAIKLSELLAASKGDIEIISSRNVTLIEQFGDAGVDVVAALRDIIIEAEPVTDLIGDMAVSFGDWAREASAAGRESGRLREFFEGSVDTLRQLGRILLNTGGLLGDVFGAALPLGQDLLDTLEDLTAEAEQFTGSAEGQNRLADFFEGIRPVLTEIGLLVGDIARGFVEFSQDPAIAEIIGLLRTELLPAFLELARTANEGFTPAVIKLIGEFVELFSTLTAGGGALTVIVDVIGELLGFINLLVEEVPGFGTFVGFMTTLAAIRGVGAVATAVGAVATNILGIGTNADTAKGKVKGLSGVLGKIGPSLLLGGTLTLASEADGIDQAIDDFLNKPVDVSKLTAGLGSVGNEAELSKVLVDNLGFTLDDLTGRIADVQTRGWLEDFVKGSSFADQAVKDLDAGLAALVQAGSADQAVAQFAGLARTLQEAGLDAGQIEAALPGVTAAFEAAGVDIAAVLAANNETIAAAAPAAAAAGAAVGAGAGGGLLGTLRNAGVEVVRFAATIPGGVSGALSGLGAAVGVRLGEVLVFFRRLPGEVIGALGGLVDGVANQVGGVVDFFRSLPGRIFSTVQNLAQDLFRIGADIIAGLINGISSKAGEITTAIKTFILDRIPEPIRRFFDSRSPSRRMAGVGREIVAGLVLGLASQGPEIDKAMAGINSRLVTQAGSLGIEGQTKVFTPDLSVDRVTGTSFFTPDLLAATAAGGSSRPVVASASAEVASATAVLAQLGAQAQLSTDALRRQSSQSDAGAASIERLVAATATLVEVLRGLDSVGGSGDMVIQDGAIRVSGVRDREVASAIPAALRRDQFARF